MQELNAMNDRVVFLQSQSILARICESNGCTLQEPSQNALFEFYVSTGLLFIDVKNEYKWRNVKGDLVYNENDVNEGLIELKSATLINLCFEAIFEMLPNIEASGLYGLESKSGNNVENGQNVFNKSELCNFIWRDYVECLEILQIKTTSGIEQINYLMRYWSIRDRSVKNAESHGFKPILSHIRRLYVAELLGVVDKDEWKKPREKLKSAQELDELLHTWLPRKI